MTAQLAPNDLYRRHGRTLAEAGPRALAEFADVERELATAGIVVPPAVPTETVSERFLLLMAHADRYDRARRMHLVAG